MFFFWSGTLNDLPMKTRTQQFSGVSSFHCTFFYSWEIYLLHTVSMFVNIQHIFPLHADWPKLTALSMALATGGTETEFNSWDVTASSPSFFALLSERPGKACLQLNMFFFNPVRVKWKQVIFFNTTCIYSMTLQRVFVEFSSSWWGPENWQNDGSICQEILRSKPWSVYVIWYAKKYYHMI